MMVAAFVFPLTMDGITLASTTRSPVSPFIKGAKQSGNDAWVASAGGVMRQLLIRAAVSFR